MRTLKIILFFIIIFISNLFLNNTQAAINLEVSPIKYELNWYTWSTIEKEAKLTNKTNEILYIITWKSDFVANWEDWVPKFIRKSELVYDQMLSEWISIDTDSFYIDPGETKIINFTIDIPENATPGWHYWAVFFKNNDSENSSWTSVWINVDYWVLILLNIDWEVDKEIEIWDPIISTSWKAKLMDVCNHTLWDKSWDYYDWKCLKEENISQSWTNSDQQDLIIEIDETDSFSWNIDKEDDKKDITNQERITVEDECIMDLTNSSFDWKCVNNIDEIVSEITWDIENQDINTNKETNNKENFEVDIKIPIENTWNAHVKPKWKIILTDENWEQIKKIWKEVITNDKWAIINQKIVDYIPINDNDWNVLPWTKRNFEVEWKWFPYKTYDKEWNIVVNYWSPGEYYTKENLNKKTFIMPWERVCKRISDKKITAKFNINYTDENWDNIEYNSAKDFFIDYEEEYIWLNPYFFMALTVFWLIILLLILIFRKKKKRCINKKCNKKIDKDIQICPYCWEKQEKKKTRKNKKTKDPEIIIPPVKKQKLKTVELNLKEKIIDILLENKLKYAEDITKLTKEDILSIKWIWNVALEDIKKALKKEKLKIKK